MILYTRSYTNESNDPSNGSYIENSAAMHKFNFIEIITRKAYIYIKCVYIREAH